MFYLGKYCYKKDGTKFNERDALEYVRNYVITEVCIKNRDKQYKT